MSANPRPLDARLSTAVSASVRPQLVISLTGNYHEKSSNVNGEGDSGDNVDNIPDVLIITSEGNRSRGLIGKSSSEMLLIKCISALVSELRHRDIQYSPSPDERIMLRALLRRIHNRWKKSVDCEDTLDEFIDNWLRFGAPFFDWVLGY